MFVNSMKYLLVQLMSYVKCVEYLFAGSLDREELFDSFETFEYYPLEKLKVSCCCIQALITLHSYIFFAVSHGFSDKLQTCIIHLYSLCYASPMENAPF